MIDEELRIFLINMPGVAAEVEERVYPQPLPQGATLPAVTMIAVSEAPTYTNEGESCYTRFRYQLDAWATTLKEAQRVNDALTYALAGYSGQIGSKNVGMARRLSSNPEYDPDPKLRRVRSDYMLHILS